MMQDAGGVLRKSCDNVIPIFVPPGQLRKRVMRIVTDSKRPEAPKEPDACNVFAIYRHFASPEAIEAMRQRYLTGGLAYSEIKHELFQRLDDTFRDARKKYEALLKDRAGIDGILRDGAEKARAIAAPMMRKIRKAVGVTVKSNPAKIISYQEGHHVHHV